MSDQKVAIVACVSWTETKQVRHPDIHILPKLYKSGDELEKAILKFIKKKFFSELDIERAYEESGFDERSVSTEDCTDILLKLAEKRGLRISYSTKPM